MAYTIIYKKFSLTNPLILPVPKEFEGQYKIQLETKYLKYDYGTRTVKNELELDISKISKFNSDLSNPVFILHLYNDPLVEKRRLFITKTNKYSIYIGYIGQRYEQIVKIPYLTNITKIVQIDGLDPYVIPTIHDKSVYHFNFKGDDLNTIIFMKMIRKKIYP